MKNEKSTKIRNAPKIMIPPMLNIIAKIPPKHPRPASEKNIRKTNPTKKKIRRISIS
jgi:hypothetical protein